jgi:hypothetical protein
MIIFEITNKTTNDISYVAELLTREEINVFNGRRFDLLFKGSPVPSSRVGAIMANFLEENGKTLDEIIDEGKKRVISSDQETVTNVIVVPNGLHSFSRPAKTRTKSTAQILNELEAQYLLLEKLMNKMKSDIHDVRQKVEEALSSIKDEKK